jgi:transglutaminase-like putative cysteine protease
VTAIAHPLRTPAGTLPSAAASARDLLVVRLAVFGALAVYGTAHWATLVVGPPGARLSAAVALALAGGAALALLGRARIRAGARAGLAAGTALATTVLALLVTGLPGRLLLPGGWAELGDGLDRGLTGVQSVDWPYGGKEQWVRLVVLLGAPLLLGVAASLAFWPARRAAPLLRGLGLVALLVLYGTAVTEHHPDSALLRGFVLLFLVAAYLWLPRLSPREAGAGAALVAAVGVLSLPLAAKLDANQPWWDYRHFNWFGHGRAVTFTWEHRYGPLDWPREGTTLMNIKSKRGHYWKAEILDLFDGFRWLRSHQTDQSAFGEIPIARRPAGEAWTYGELNPRWLQSFRVTVRALRSDFVVGTGNTFAIEGLGESTAGTADGTTLKLDEPLKRGDSYTVRAYAPDPTAAQMRGAPAAYPADLISSTRVVLPRSGESAVDGISGDASRSAEGAPPTVFPDLRGAPASGTRGAGRRLATSPYGRMYALARQLAAGQPTSYDVVKAVEDHLQRNYQYAERVPRHDFPLESFLFEDRRGYCQQFSGAMALMLRMVGIPARVAAGFSPGSYNRDTGEWRVRDFDAHSWVEVYFPGIGWVPFDPTPAASPARSQSAGLDATSAAAGDAGEARAETSRSRGTESGIGQGPASGAGEGPGSTPWVVGAVAILVASGLGLGGSALLRRRRGPPAGVDAQVLELRTALERLGWRIPESTTLLGLERRLAGAAGPRAAEYAARLRAHRFDRHDPGPPDAAARRALRRELTDRGGLRARLLGLLALPPRGPRTS